MMPGVAAQPLGQHTAPSITSLVAINFIAGTYLVNGVTKTAADVIANPELITADGLVMTDGVVDIIGDLLPYVLANGTFRLVWDHLDYTGSIVPLAIINSGTSDDGVIVKRQDSLGSNFMNLSDFSGSHFRQAVDASAPIGDNGHVIAWTRTDSELEFSVDGRSVVPYSGDPDTFSIAPNAASFGGLPGNFVNAETRIKSLTVYATQASSLLPALAA
jgi:hypothetical protein